MSRIIGFVFLILLAALVLSFTSLNAQSVQINYYFGSTEIPVAIAIALSIAVGILFGFFAGMRIIFRLKRENSKLKKSGRLAEKELEHLRTVSAQDH